ncbi:HAD family hydrolase [Actinopolymorpha pittospori]|uniref:Uncharacterized protein n=1 Tax=Actinopolymorpha pittospori TaxID=648752 RepID=A0A927N3A4_9ACTN|nr:HAD hydrolase family protein [Actinopolymorpha pittospori]MBE1608157.1 hypothetical protein [Actinopolymorpha pittospori]
MPAYVPLAVIGALEGRGSDRSFRPTPPRLVVSDLDGRLLRSDGTVSDRTRSALAAVEDAGATVVFAATCRPPQWMRPVAQATGHRGIAVCSNGALVYDPHQEEIIEAFPLAPEVGHAVVEAIRMSIPRVSFGVEFGGRFGHGKTYLVIAVTDWARRSSGRSPTCWSSPR